MPDFTDGLRPAEPSGAQALAAQRAGSDIPVQKLARHLLSQNEFLGRQDRVLKEVLKERLLDKSTQQQLSRPERYKLGLARAKLLRRMANELGWDHEDHKMAEYLVDDVSPYMLHMSMFVTTIREQGSDEQRAYWLPLIEKWEIIGAYAQTELGHGSNVKGLELQATWDRERKHFVFHSPTLTASKWWNGSLGRTATHSIVVAQLILPNKGGTGVRNHGPHPFIIRVRDEKTHQPLPGIVVGDIGPKYGYSSMDNGYMLFNKFHVAHSAFLSRYFQVDENTGMYSSTAQNPAVIYGSLTNIRVNIVMHARLVLARAVTVAVRYLTIRRQFRDRDDTGGNSLERAVLDYPTVQIRVLPLLATTFALHYTGRVVGQRYKEIRENIEKGDLSELAELHATSSGLKSLCTTLAADGIETCRRALGGHGFGGGSGLIQLNADYLSKPTVEGDNAMITQQTASYIIKKMQSLAEATDNRTLTHTSNAIDRSFREHLVAMKAGLTEKDCLSILTDDAAIVHAFERRAAHFSWQAYQARMIKNTPWTSLLIQLHALSNAHSQAILVRNFHLALCMSSPIDEVPSGAKSALSVCFRLFAFHTINNCARDFSASMAVSNPDLDSLPQRVLELMGQLQPHAVALVDAWSIPDYLLDSALGRSDGRVYEDLFNRAHRMNPLNKETFNPYYWDESIYMKKPKL